MKRGSILAVLLTLWGKVSSLAETAAPISTALRVRGVSAAGGKVQFGGELWHAVLADTGAGMPLPTGAKITVAAVDGMTLVVVPASPAV